MYQTMPFQKTNGIQSTEYFANPARSIHLLILLPTMPYWLNMVIASDAKIY
ncbi:MAG: hypothetical protein KGI27_11655 [Thaumarchaeota archaeon]|nr:hypothetical protein [Nitrososphaerota archaeon]